MVWSNADLVAEAGGDPWALRDDLSDGNPAEIIALAQQFHLASGQAADATDFAAIADEITAANYKVDDTPVHDVNAHLQQTRIKLGNSGENMYRIARSLATIADELADRTTAANGIITELEHNLAGVRSAVRELGVLDYLRHAPEMRGFAVGLIVTAHEKIQKLVDGYEEILNSQLRDLAGMGYHPPTEINVGHPFDKPPIPGAPPNQTTDPGAGEHGSEPWYSRGDDLFVRSLANRAATVADAIGWTHAAAHMRHYLGNSGKDLTVSPDEMMRDADSFRAIVDKTIAAEMRSVAAEAETNGTYGKPVQLTSGWQGYTISPAENKDWFYAMGAVQYSVTGVATVHAPDHPGGDPRIEMDYKVHVSDRYNWDIGAGGGTPKSTSFETPLGEITIPDQAMADLHRAGVAQEFNMSGSTDAKHYSGPVPPPGQQPNLPPPPDNRDGTRTDPGR